MVLAELHPLTTGKDQTASSTQAGADDIRVFLERELPPAIRNQAPYLTTSLRDAAARYERYIARKEEWRDYAKRRRRLEAIRKLSESLASDLSALDSLSRDDLMRRFESEKLITLIGSLNILREEAEALANTVQRNGRARDLAEERWIAEVADIYENIFGRPARVWGSGADTGKRRGKFYDLLMISRPTSFLRYGKLNPRQIDRVLRRRKKPESRILVI